MGMTLPILVKAMSKGDHNFGRVIALLYGFNTLGAAGGVLASELFIVPSIGLMGAGIVALAFNLFNAVAALVMARTESAAIVDVIVTATEKQEVEADTADRWTPARILATSFLTGFCLLALEVLWFRFLLTFFGGFSLNFAIMLMVVLLGIAGGSLLASQWFKRNPEAHGYLAPLLGAAGIYLLFAYNAYELVAVQLLPDRILVAALFLMLPVALVSGAAFTMLGRVFALEVGGICKLIYDLLCGR